ncbi:hypothetical protein HUB98_04090 [Paenibacillus barcinonensis]|uniref:Uncharacterized protein n=1 Tax=Paenibacillus barcinonensis TaxID=198119 RepID=A0A2V4VAT9_PAEBA|nr:hypothetical protein [Paenibacillus barcinonensis]PYE43292.1 hypothetical protein DFQ00_12953 [Paenibacillus barcinonensis]QKS55577.1 hypothetical protein HUB98_04090 [Paenibacillus barcinonensis]
MRKNFIISKQSDFDGFNSFQCSLCGAGFKLDSEEVQAGDVLELFCPSCGIPMPKSSYLTDDILKHARQVAKNEAIKELSKIFKGLQKSSGKNNGLTFKAGKPILTTNTTPLYEQDDLDEIKFTCCDKNAKLDIADKIGNPFCPYCGVN